MTRHDETRGFTEADLAHLAQVGDRTFAEMGGEELNGKFPGLPEIAPGTKLWALFAANGQPILISDARERAIAGAFENDLTPVSIH